MISDKNKKRSIIRSLIPESPIGSPSPSRKPILASYFASITVSELLMFSTFKYLNFSKVSELLKVPYLVGLLLKQACCLLRQLLQRMLLLLRMQFLILT